MTLLDVIADVPEFFLDTSGVGEFNIMKLLVCQKIGNQLHILHGNTAGDKLVQNRGHFLFGKSPAFKQDLADSEDLTVCH